MTHTYQISGMTCNGCRASVERKLNETPGVTKATVDLQKAEAVIEMESHIPLEKFQDQLKDSHYSISVPGEAVSADAPESKKKAFKGT